MRQVQHEIPWLCQHLVTRQTDCNSELTALLHEMLLELWHVALHGVTSVAAHFTLLILMCRGCINQQLTLCRQILNDRGQLQKERSCE